MSSKFLIPALLVSLLAGCASSTVASTDDAARAHVLAQLDVTPDWVKIANPAGVIMTDGHLAQADAPAVATAAPRSIAAAPAPALMSDGHPEFDAAARTVKGGDSAN
jgi:hypothetical protein